MLTLADIRSQYPGADALSDDELIGVTAERYGTTPDVFKEAIGYQPPKVEPTGVMDEIGRGLIHGAKVTLPKAVGEAAQFFGADEFGSKMVQDANAREAADNQESAYGRSLDSPYSPRGNVYEAADNSVLSVAPGAAGAAIGAGVGAFFGGIGAGPGALIGYGIGSLASLPIFYGSQGQSSSDRIREAQLKAGATPEQADSEARIGGHQAGAIEAGGELVADIIPFAKMFKPFAKPAAKAAGTLVKDLFFPTVGRGLKTVGQTVAGEVVTEMGQQAGEDAVEGAHGAGEGATWDSTSRVIMPTALMSLIPGMAGAASKHAQVNASRKALESPDTPQNVRAGLAAAAVHEMSGISQDTAKAFSLYAGKQIEAGQPIKFEGDDFYKAAKAAPAEEKPAGILQLANTSDPMVGFPDGTVGRRADVDRYINSLPEDQRVSARSKLYGFGPEQAINAIGAAASVDEAIAAANAAVSAPTTLTGQDRATLMTPPENIMGAVYERQAQTAADQADLDAFVQSETRDLNTLRAQTIENMRKQREMDQIQSAGTGQYGVRPEQRAAVADAATVDAPTAMQLAMQRATRKSDPTAQTESPPTAAQLPSASAVGAAQQTQTLAPGSDALRPPTLAKGQDAGSGQTVLASQNDTSQPDILPTDIARLDGKPFQTANGARLKQREAGGIEGSDIVPVSGGFVVRPKVSQPQEQVSAKSQETVESTSGRPAPVGPAIDAGAATGHAAPAVEPAANGAVVQVDNAQSNAGSLTVPQKLQVTFGGKTYPVESIEDAQRKWIKFQETADGGGPVGVSKVGNGVQITDQNGKFVARISFNGRVWNGEGDDAKVIAEAPRPAPDQRLVPVSKRALAQPETKPQSAAVPDQAPQAESPAPIAQASPVPSAVSPVQNQSSANDTPPAGKVVSTYIGKFKKGMGKDAARLEASKRNRSGDGITYTAEEHGDATLENPYAVVGRKTQEPVAEAAAALVVEGKDPVALAQAEYDKAKKALDAIGKEPPQRSSEAKAFGQRGRAGADPEVVAKYDADVKAHAAWRRKYSALKKAEVERSNELFYAKKAVQGYVQSDVAPPAPENSDAPAEPEATPATQATAALDAANVTGKERLDVLKDVKAGTLTPEEVKAAYPAPVSSREGQMNLANRGSRIASLKLMNEQLRKIAPDEAWHDKNIEDAKDLDALQDQISEALVKANRGSQDASPLRTELEQLSGAELRTIFEKMNLAGTRMTATERVDALVAENEAEVRAAMASTNTENAGDELTYNKRNRVKSGIKWDDIADKDVALRVKETTKANVHPKPDYQAMVDGGMEPIVAHMVKQAYDSLSVAPNTGNYAPTDADLKRYIDGVHRYMDGVMAWANDKDQIRAWVARIGKRAGVLAGASSGQMTSLSEIAGQSEKSLIDVVYPDGWKNHRDELRSIGGNKALNGLQPSTDEAMKAVKDIEKGWPGKQEAWQRQGYKIVDGKDLKADFYTGKHGNGDPYTTAWLRSGRITIVQRSFDGATSKDDPIVQDWVKLETEAYAGRHVLLNKSNRVVGWGMTPEEAVELARSETKRDGKTTISDKGISVESAEREGVQHRMDGEDISSDRLKEAFGLKGVNFGNWMLGKSHEKERQLHLNHAYDSFMDLAQALGVPPKALSLNGMLGLAIGAQGNGKAAAHFVPGVNEINLTRTSGAGSLAHEFGHGLDHYFARHADLGRNSDPFLTEYASRKLAGDIRPEIVEAFKTIVQAMNKRPTTQAETALRRQESIKKAKRNVDGWMASIRKDFERIAESDKKAPAGMLEQFDALAQRIKALDLGDGRVAVSGGFTMSQPVSDMRDLYKQATGRVYSLDQIKGLQSNVDHLKYLSDAIDSAAGHVPQQVMTDYAAAALRIDKEKGGKPYWSTNLEKFARAFDAFISDKLEAAAAKNTYLSHAGRTGETVPMGTERTAINAGIQQLIDTIQTKEDDAGNVAMFNTKDDVGGQTQTAAFKKWFSGSKVVDADGNPLVVYHGTKSGGFSTFAVPDMERSGKSGSLTTGAYFTDKKHVSTTHSGPIYRDAESAIALKDKHKISTAAIYDVYLSLQNPKIVNFKGRDWQGEDVHGDVISGGSTDGQAILAKQEGYDGLIIRNVRDTADGARMSNKDARSTVYVAFSPTQIKSAIGNNGTFDPANPDIRFNSDSGPDGLPMFAQAAYTPANGQQQSTADLTQAAQGNIDRLNRAITRFLDKPGTAARPFQARRLRDHAGLQGLGDAFGAKVQGFRVDPSLRADVAREFDFFNGVYTSGTIYLNENSQRPHLAILGHELAHQLRKTNYVLYRQLVNAIEPFIDKAKYPAFARTAVGREHANNAEKLREEFVGEVLSDGFMNRDFWRAVGKKNPSLLQRIVRMVGELLNKALAKMGYSNRSEQYLTDFNRVMQVAGEVMGEYGLKPPAVVAGGGLSFGRGANAPVATNDDAAGISLGGRSAGDNTSGVLFTDENENAIVFASGDFRISVNKPGGASFVVLWAKQEVNGKTYWRKAGTLNTNEKSKIINGVAGHYLGVSSVSIEKEYRGRGMGLQMYRALLSQAAPDIAGIISHTPSRVNKKQVPSIYRSLGAFSDGDNQIIPTRRNESTAPDSGGAVSFNTKITGQITGQTIAQAWQAPDATKMDDFIYSIQDKHIDTKRVVKAVRDAIGSIADNLDPYLQEELYHGRAAMATKEFLEKSIRPLLTDMQSRGIDISDFEEYLHNRHAERRNVQVAKVNPTMQDGGSGIKTADARAYLAGLPAAKRTAYQALARRIDQMNRETRALLVSSGLEKQSTIDAWEMAYGDEYVPLMREEMDNGAMGIGQGFSVRGSSSKRAMGSDKPVANILANMALQREKAITRAEKRKIGEALYGMVLSAPNPDFWFAIDPALAQNPSQITATAFQLISMGMSPADAEAIAAEPTQRYIDPRTKQVAYRINPALRSADNVLAVRIDGEDKYVFFNAQDERAMRMAKALKNLDSDQLGFVLGTTAKVTRYFSAVNTQWNPIFGVVNITRDIQTALLNLQSTPLHGKQVEVMKHVGSALKGIYIDLRDHRAGKTPSSSWAQLFEEFQREGGATGYRDMYANAKERADSIVSELKQIKSGTALNVGRGIMGWLSDYNEAMENAVRVASYKVGKEQGMSNQQAASLAKNLTVNFNRKGQTALQAGALYAFFNASIQGSARMAQTMFEGGKLSGIGKKILTGGLLLGSMQALLLAAAGFDDDEPPDFVRERSLVIPIGGDKYVSIPMPLGFHVIPNLARIPTEWAMGGFKNTPKRIAQLVGLFADAFNPIGGAGLSLQTLTPTIIDPLAALAENKDWTGKPIARKDFSSLKPTAGHTRAKDTATPWAKAISYAVNMATGGTDYKPGMVSPTPDQIDYLIGQATGGVGREASKLSQVASSTLSGEELPLYKIPLVGRFVGTTAGQAAEASRFYENMREIGEHDSELTGLRKDHKMAERAQYMRENREAMLVPIANKTYREVSKLNTQKRDLIKAGASRDRVKLIEQQITARMRAFNTRVEAMREPAT